MKDSKGKILIAMSGGVDSSVSAYLLQKEGHDCTGITFTLEQHTSKISNDTNVQDAKRICERLGIKHITIDISQQFKTCVIDYFVQSYKLGETPNPCSICNKLIKFGFLADYAFDNGYDFISTGHYAKIEQGMICKANDISKDQSYFLGLIRPSILNKIILPLGIYTKSEVRQIAESLGFDSAHKSDSQDICFVESDNYVDVINRYSMNESNVGDFVDVSGKVLGTHQGLIHYTIGQRKGLGIALGKPAYVKSKNYEANTIVLAEDKDLFDREIYITDCNWFVAAPTTQSFKALVRLRSRHNEAAATITKISEGSAIIVFDEAQRAIAPGQIAVIYDNDIVIGAGIIRETK